MPNVPNVLGVPALLSYSQAGVALLAADAFAAIVGALGIGPQWGLFRFGLPAIFADSVVAFDYRQDWTVSNYPLEQGAFESYDKVQVPFGIRLQFAKGGSPLERQAFLASIALQAGTLAIYDVITPEAIYPNVNIVHYDYRRSAENVGLLVVDVWVVEVRQNAQALFTNTAAPAGADRVSDGTVQPQAPSSGVNVSVIPFGQAGATVQ